MKLLANILIAKYADALPLCLLENILEHCGGDISQATMANWIIRLDNVFKPLIHLLQEYQRSVEALLKQVMLSALIPCQHQFSLHGIDVFCLATRKKYHEKYH